MASHDWQLQHTAEDGNEASVYDSGLMARLSNTEIMSILSAREYPIVTADSFDNTDAIDLHSFPNLSFGFSMARDTGDHSSSNGSHRSLAENYGQMLSPSSDEPLQPSAKSKTEASRKRVHDGEGPKERRKKQIREAQRAYRLRKESRISYLTRRVAQLEQVIEDMSTSVVTFSDSLLRSGVLSAHADLTRCARETLEKCVELAKITTIDDEGAEPDKEPQVDVIATTAATSRSLMAQTPNMTFSKDVLPFLRPDYEAPSFSAAGTTTTIQYSAFMDQLHLAILQRGYVILTDPAITLDGVRQRFRLLYPVMDRSRIAAYFAAALHAKLGKQDFVNRLSPVPFFQLGGAGTHYAWPPELGPYTRRSRQWTSVPVPLSHFSKDIQQHLTGDWFDMQDLECFLMDKKVTLVSPVSPIESMSLRASPTKRVNASKLAADLLEKAFCLGRSAGFRRSDVEVAINKAILV